MSTLKVVALISGGKDSLFSILHCLTNGHEVVALANLHPTVQHNGSTIEDTDSYMYQTIGHTVIPLYEKALGLPLYRQEIVGSAVDQSKSYGPSAHSDSKHADETESLVPLLHKVLAAHPEINAVSTGAILSDYQRTRVESVALRLGLTPLSYLWQYPHLPPATQTSLLEDMMAIGQDARIIKVASGGLDDSFLWQNVADRRIIARLVKASKMFGVAGDGSALGEGGEYETLAIAGPPPLWKSRIVISDSEIETIPGEAGSASVRVIRADIGPLESMEQQEVRVPELLDEQFKNLLDTESMAAERPESPQLELNEDSVPISPCEGHRVFETLTGQGENATEQTEAIIEDFRRQLNDAGHNLADVAYISIVLRDMGDFAAVNKVYGNSFAYANPPARITLACTSALPKGAFLAISATSVRASIPDARQGLHVQSRSYWAPANIGPYSQAISVPMTVGHVHDGPKLIYVAGQIPLVPASMELCTPHVEDTEANFLTQAVLALQHLFRIGAAVKSRQWIKVLAFITAPCLETARQRAKRARLLWRRAHQATKNLSEAEDEDENFDVWNEQRGQGRGAWQTHTNLAGGIAASPNPLGPSQITVLHVDSLPRGASIEWVAYGLSENTAVRYAVPHLEHLLQVFKQCVR